MQNLTRAMRFCCPTRLRRQQLARVTIRTANLHQPAPALAHRLQAGCARPSTCHVIVRRAGTSLTRHHYPRLRQRSRTSISRARRKFVTSRPHSLHRQTKSTSTRCGILQSQICVLWRYTTCCPTRRSGRTSTTCSDSRNGLASGQQT